MNDLTIEDLEALVFETLTIKEKPEQYCDSLAGRVLLMLFEKPSTRTRVSFATAMFQLGGNAIDLNQEMLQLGRGESLEDSARVLGRYADCIVARVKKHDTLVELANNSGIPILNGLSEIEHPCQVIADLFTMYESRGKLKGLQLGYIGDGNNVCNSLILGCAMMGVSITVAAPRGYAPADVFIDRATEIGHTTGSQIEVVEDPVVAAKNADFLYTDVWVSMGFESESQARINEFRDYQINSEILSHAENDCKVMHCLPAHRGLEITSDVIDGEHSIVWDQAENRLHAQKAILIKALE